MVLQNVNYTNPFYDWTDSCWNPVDFQLGIFAIICCYCSFSTSRHFIPHQFFFFWFIRAGCIDLRLKVEGSNESIKEPSDIFVIVEEAL